MLIRFKENITVRLWGKTFHSYAKGNVYNVPIAVVGVLLAQGCAEPVASPPARPNAAVRRAA